MAIGSPAYTEASEAVRLYFTVYETLNQTLGWVLPESFFSQKKLVLADCGVSGDIVYVYNVGNPKVAKNRMVVSILLLALGAVFHDVHGVLTVEPDKVDDYKLAIRDCAGYVKQVSEGAMSWRNACNEISDRLILFATK